jgi:hypothetical protein
MRAQLEERLSRYVVSATSRKWLIKSLDPASEGSSPGLPDENSCCVSRPEFKTQMTIAPPGGTNGPWDCMIFAPPGDSNAFYFASAAQDSGVPVDFTSSTAPTTYAVGRLQIQAPEDSTAAIALNGFSFQTLATPVPVGLNCGSRNNNSQATTFRHQYKSLTCELVCSDLANQGDVYCGQCPTDIFEHRVVGSVVSNAVGQILVNTQTCLMPLTESDLLLSAPGAYSGLAREGVYTISRLMGPSQPFASVDVDANTSINILNDSTTPPPVVVWPVTAPGVYGASGVQFPQTLVLRHAIRGVPGGAQAPPWINQATFPATNDGSMSFDSGYDKLTTPIIIFRGLSGASGQSASIMVKAIVGLEVCPRPTSPFRVYQKSPMLYDPRAMEAYYAIAIEVADGYPARFNALGAILPVIASIASRLWPAIPAILKGAYDGFKKYGGFSAIINGQQAAAAPVARPSRARVEEPSTALVVRRPTRSVSRSASRPRVKIATTPRRRRRR